MKHSIGIWQLMGFAATSLGGTILHFYTPDRLNIAIFKAPLTGTKKGLLHLGITEKERNYRKKTVVSL